MFRPPIAAALLMGFVLLGIGWAAIGPWLEPSPRELGAHTYSGRIIGHRAVYETLQELGVPVSRSAAIPTELFQGRRRVVLMQPNFIHIETEKRYIREMARWVEDGGQLVVVTDTFKSFPWDETVPINVVRRIREDVKEVLGEDAFLASLGIEGLEILPDLDRFPVTNPADVYMIDIIGAIRKPERSYTVHGYGSLAGTAANAPTVALPGLGDLSHFSGKIVEQAAGRVEVETARGGRQVIALEYQKGRGSVTLLSEPVLCSNLGMSKEDNAVVAYHLIVGAGDRPVVFDEYYHGLMPQGNAFVLLGVYPYSAFAAALLAAALVWAWSCGVRLGPPVKDFPVMRRNILEYVDAMGRLFRRGRKERFILRTLAEGMLEEVRHELLMAPGTARSVVLRRLGHLAPERALRLAAALEEVDTALAAERPVPPARLLELQQRMEACRSLKTRLAPL